jgi:hypothetical protein
MRLKYLVKQYQLTRKAPEREPFLFYKQTTSVS